jgi:hypothetical protein
LDIDDAINPVVFITGIVLILGAMAVLGAKGRKDPSPLPSSHLKASLFGGVLPDIHSGGLPGIGQRESIPVLESFIAPLNLSK